MFSPDSKRHWARDKEGQKKFTAPFSSLLLSSDAVLELETVTRTLVARNITTYEQWAAETSDHVDRTRWRLLGKQDGLQAYVERNTRPSFSFGAAMGAAVGHLDTHESVFLCSSTASVPSILVVGALDGELDDAMYSVMCPTLEQMRVRTSYVNDGLVRGSVLATLVLPTVQDPFTSVAVKWTEKGPPIPARAIIKNRDYVYLEATGVEYLRNGERVGYHVVHSIQFPETPERSSAVRGNISICAVYRQRNSDETAVYIRAFVNPMSELENFIIMRSVARTLLSVSKNVHSCRMKKIQLAIQQRHHLTLVHDHLPALTSTSDGPCGICDTRRSTIFSRVAAVASQIASRKNFRWQRRCELCKRYVCPDCRNLQKLTFVLPDRRLVQQHIALCNGCQENALSVKAVDAARYELKHKRSSSIEWRDTHVTHTSSNSETVT